MLEMMGGIEALMNGAAEAGCRMVTASGRLDALVSSMLAGCVPAGTEFLAAGSSSTAVEQALSLQAEKGCRLALVGGFELATCLEGIGLARERSTPLVVVAIQHAAVELAQARMLAYSHQGLRVLVPTNVDRTASLSHAAVRLAMQAQGPCVVLLSRLIASMRVTVSGDPITPQPDSSTLVESDLDSGADTLLVGYGINDGGVREAVRYLRGVGARVSRLSLFELWPVPRKTFSQARTRRKQRVFVVEPEACHYADEVRRVMPGIAVESIAPAEGDLVHPQTIVRSVLEPVCG